MQIPSLLQTCMWVEVRMGSFFPRIATGRKSVSSFFLTAPPQRSTFAEVWGSWSMVANFQP